ncbi:N/A [soil metagenome]
MRTPPTGIEPEAVLAAVREHWLPDTTSVEHLPVGFGAHHWAALVDDAPTLFVTLDALGSRHSFASLTAAYAGAAELRASGLDLVHAGVAPYAVPFGDRALSVTPWLSGSNPEVLDPRITAAMLDRLQASPAPTGLPRWQPLVGSDLAADLTRRVRAPWSRGPHGETARAAVADHLDDLVRWVEDYHRLAEIARTRAWVPTHGEPHRGNQVVTRDGTVLVDWESLKLAPAERDLRTLDPRLGAADMQALCDLEWRLDEVSQYADWFEGDHAGTEDDTIALAGLVEELERSR